MYRTNVEDAQTDRSLVWSHFPQVNFLENVINHKMIRDEARDHRMNSLCLLSHVLTDKALYVVTFHFSGVEVYSLNKGCHT